MEISKVLYLIWVLTLIGSCIYGVNYGFIEANRTTPELNQAQAFLTTAQGATNLVYMSELINKAADAIVDKHGNPAWVVQTSYTDYEALREDMKTVANYCLRLNDRLSSTGQGILSDSWTYYANAIEKVRETDIQTLRNRISSCFAVETAGSQTALTRFGIVIIFLISSFCLLLKYGYSIDYRWGRFVKVIR